MGSRQEDLENLINRHNRRLQKLKEQLATYGRSADPSIEMQIEDIENEKKRLFAELQQLIGASIENKSSAVNNWNSLMKVGTSNLNHYNNQAALEYFELALELSRAINDRKKEMLALTFMGHACSRLKIEQKFQFAKEPVHDPLDHYENAARIARQIGHHKEEGWLYIDMGRANHEKIASDEYPKYDEVLKCYKRALAISRSINDQLLEGWALNELGNIYMFLNEYLQAEALCKSAMEIARELVGSPQLSDPSDRRARELLESSAESHFIHARKQLGKIS